jgi:histone-lysine N-methyltransferase SETMAR
MVNFVKVIKRLVSRVHYVTPEFQENGSWCILYKALAHSSGFVSEFLAKRGIPVLSHPPYSPDLTPADFLLFPKLKIEMKGTRLDVVPSIQQTVTRVLKAIRKEAFSLTFDSLYERCKYCAEADRD